MITPKIKALFQFIDFLHSNIENFNRYNNLIKELETLKTDKDKLSPRKNYKDKLECDKVQAELESKFKTLQDNTANLIRNKAIELNVCNFENEPRYNWQGVQTDVHKLKKKFSSKDLPEIFKHKSQYLEYRSQTHKTFLSLKFFFDELDEITKSLFDYFKDTEQNEFEPFETKTVQVGSFSEALKGFNKGQTKFKIQDKLVDHNFFQIEVIADLEHEGKIYNNVKQINNDSILTPENWEQYKETFFVQRMETYKQSYTLAEKIKLELSALEKLPINKTDYQILKDRYIDYLEQKQALPPEPIDDNQSQSKKETPKIFDELFYNSELITPCIDVLKELEPPLIDSENNYIGKLKGIICVWIEEMQRQGIVKHFSDRKIFASLIPHKIKRFSIDESMFGKYHTKAENLYRTDIKTKISKVKLSQDSHKGK